MPGPHGPLRKFCYLDKEYHEYRGLEIVSSIPHNDKRTSHLPARDILYLETTRETLDITYVSTKVYFVDKWALVKLWNHAPRDRRVSNMDTLVERIKDTEEHFYTPDDPRWHPAYRGGRVDRTHVGMEATEESHLSEAWS